MDNALRSDIFVLTVERDCDPIFSYEFTFVDLASYPEQVQVALAEFERLHPSFELRDDAIAVSVGMKH